MKSITIFTPTYNRGYCLSDLYESLRRQINEDFKWLIIDDGSTDKTWDLVEDWLFRKEVDIEYIKQENVGIHASHNVAYENVTTEFVMCVDSDDYLPDYAVGMILENIKALQPRHAGLMGFEVNDFGVTVGSDFPENLKESTVHDLYAVHKVKGHKKLIYRSAIVKAYPKYPVFPGEKSLPLGILYSKIDQDYTMKILNEPISVCRYPDDRYSRNMLVQTLKNLSGFSYVALEKIKLYTDKKSRYKNAVLLTAFSKFLNDPDLVNKIDDKRLISRAKLCGLYQYYKMNKKSKL